MKVLALALGMFIAPAALAAGTCVSQADKGAHEQFCNNLNQQACDTHSSLCTWENAQVKQLRVVGSVDSSTTEELKVIETVEHSCVAKEGMGAHASFCGNQNKMTCNVHSMCKWQ